MDKSSSSSSDLVEEVDETVVVAVDNVIMVSAVEILRSTSVVATSSVVVKSVSSNTDLELDNSFISEVISDGTRSWTVTADCVVKGMDEDAELCADSREETSLISVVTKLEDSSDKTDSVAEVGDTVVDDVETIISSLLSR